MNPCFSYYFQTKYKPVWHFLIWSCCQCVDFEALQWIVFKVFTSDHAGIKLAILYSMTDQIVRGWPSGGAYTYFYTSHEVTPIINSRNIYFPSPSLKNSPFVFPCVMNFKSEFWWFLSEVSSSLFTTKTFLSCIYGKLFFGFKCCGCTQGRR